MNLFENITIERLQQIEEEREATQFDPEFQRWMKELNVSKMYVNKDGIINARNMMQDYSIAKTYKLK